MQLEITGHHIEVTEALRRHIEEKAERLTRHFDQVLNIHVILEVQKKSHHAEATLHVSGNHLFADAASEDMYSTINSLVDKLDRQIIKHKEKTRGHSRDSISDNLQPA